MSSEVGLTGLVNLGNTCFLNSCIQVLNHIYEIFDMKTKLYGSLKNVPEADLLREWMALKNLMWSKNGTVNPIPLVSTIQRIARIKKRELFTGWAQNDMPEFLLFMIECMHASICRPVIMKINGTQMNDKDAMAFSCYKMLQEVYTKEYSEILDLFYGIYVSEIYSEQQGGNISNKRLSLKPEPFFILDLPLPVSFNEKSNRERIISLYECFDLFTQTEYIHGENAWYNEETQQYQNVLKRLTFWNFPKILVITLKRFSPDGMRKLENIVDFPVEHLDLSKYVFGYNPHQYVYELFGVCNHSGGTMGGHYTSYVKKNGSKWYHYNDASVLPFHEHVSPVSQMAYCLFYRKKNNS